MHTYRVCVMATELKTSMSIDPMVNPYVTSSDCSCNHLVQTRIKWQKFQLWLVLLSIRNIMVKFDVHFMPPKHIECLRHMNRFSRAYWLSQAHISEYHISRLLDILRDMDAISRWLETVGLSIRFHWRTHMVDVAPLLVITTSFAKYKREAALIRSWEVVQV